jgi:hypothetical protein
LLDTGKYRLQNETDQRRDTSGGLYRASYLLFAAARGIEHRLEIWQTLSAPRLQVVTARLDTVPHILIHGRESSLAQRNESEKYTEVLEGGLGAAGIGGIIDERYLGVTG